MRLTLSPCHPHSAVSSPGGGGTMKRLLRWTFNTLAAASLLLCVAAALVWVCSYWAYDTFVAGRGEASSYGREFGTRKYECFVVSYRGEIRVWFGWFGGPEDQ